MAALLNTDPPDLGAAAAPIPPGLVRIVNRCLEKNPSARFQSASDLAFAIESLASSASTVTDTHSRWRPAAQLGWGCVGDSPVAIVLAAANAG
jgi:serine/threonine protein kinase